MDKNFELLFRKKKVLISRELKPNSDFKRLVEPFYTIVEKPFIEFQEIKVQNIPDTPWVFFSSPKAVELFLIQVQPEWFKNKKVACIGKGTHQALLQQNILPQFSGRGNVEHVGDALAATIGLEMVLFPIGSQSRRTVQKKLPQKQVIELEIYRTVSVEHTIPNNVDALVFTSPSNVHAFSKANEIMGFQKQMIAIGSSTSNALNTYNIPHLISTEPTELNLAERLIGSL